MKATSIAKLDRPIRKFVGRMPPGLVVKAYSKGRLHFLHELSKDLPAEPFVAPAEFSRTFWGLKFNSPIMNAAGMFKNGESYDVVAAQGAGAYLGGTGTWNKRSGNSKEGYTLPFAPYPLSHAASNWLGLPNKGDLSNSFAAERIKKVLGVPLGWSVMGSPDLQGDEKLFELVRGMHLYDVAGVNGFRSYDERHTVSLRIICA